MKIAILTTPNQWFVSYAKELQGKLIDSKLFFDHKDLEDSYDIVFILSYHKIIEKEYLEKNKHNIVKTMKERQAENQAIDEKKLENKKQEEREIKEKERDISIQSKYTK